MADYSEAIEKGVAKWFDANQDIVIDIVRKAVTASTVLAIEGLTDGAMTSVGKFLDANKDDIISGIAIAIATSWQARQHPVSSAKPISYDRKGKL